MKLKFTQQQKSEKRMVKVIVHCEQCNKDHVTKNVIVTKCKECDSIVELKEIIDDFNNFEKTIKEENEDLQMRLL